MFRPATQSGTMQGVSLLPPAEPGRSGVRQRLHRHRFRWVREDPFSGSSLYACRCGVVRPAP